MLGQGMDGMRLDTMLEHSEDIVRMCERMNVVDVPEGESPCQQDPQELLDAMSADINKTLGPKLDQAAEARAAGETKGQLEQLLEQAMDDNGFHIQGPLGQRWARAKTRGRPEGQVRAVCWP